MLFWLIMCGKTRRDRFRNDIREEVRVAAIVEKTVENRLRWFGHVECWLCSKKSRPHGGQSSH